MKNRCNNPATAQRADYHDRGIKVCQRWSDSFEAFLADMGPCPPGLSLERVENSQGYEPGNCIWADRSTQNRNRRSVVWVDYEGKRMTLKEASTAAGVPYPTVKSRRQNGIPECDWFTQGRINSAQKEK